MNPLRWLLVCLIVLTIGCSDDPFSSGNGADQYNGVNGIVINGGELENVIVNFSSYGQASYDASSSPAVTKVTALGVVDGESTQFELSFPSDKPGTYNWKTQSPSTGDQDTYLMIMIGASPDNIYYAKSGVTEVSEYGAVGAKVSGRFTGTLRTLTSQKSVVVNGKFVAVRFQ